MQLEDLRLTGYRNIGKGTVRSIVNIKAASETETQFFICGDRKVSGLYDLDTAVRDPLHDIDNFTASAAVLGSHVFIGDDRGYVHKYNLETHSICASALVSNSRICSIVPNYVSQDEAYTLSCGSWDGSVYVIHRDGLNVMSRYANLLLKHAVACGYINGTQILGSQTGHVQFIRDTNTVHTEMNLHADIVREFRALGKLPIIVSCSNDGYVKFVNANSFEVLLETKVCPYFIYTVLPYDNDDGTYMILTGGENGIHGFTTRATEASVELLTEPRIIYSTPSAVWCSMILSSFATDAAASSRPRLLFGSDSGELFELSNHGEPIDISSISSSPVKSNLTPYSECDKVIGSRPGQTRLFLDASRNVVVICKWVNDTWELIGDVVNTANPMPSADKKSSFYPGDAAFDPGYYDYIFNVEVENLNGAIYYLPYKIGDNKTSVATRFCNLHSLPASSVDDIIHFIDRNAGTPCDADQPNGSEADMQLGDTQLNSQTWSPVAYNNVDKLSKMIISLKPIWEKNDLNPLVPFSDIEGLDQIICNNKQSLDNVQYSDCLVCLIFSEASVIRSFSRADLVPILDLARILILSRKVIDRIAVKHSLMGTLRWLLDLIEPSMDSLSVVTLRCFVNLSSHKMVVEYCLCMKLREKFSTQFKLDKGLKPLEYFLGNMIGFLDTHQPLNTEAKNNLSQIMKNKC